MACDALKPQLGAPETLVSSISKRRASSSEPDYDLEGQTHLEWLAEQELSDSESSEAGAKPKAPGTKAKSDKRHRG